MAHSVGHGDVCKDPACKHCPVCRNMTFAKADGRCLYCYPDCKNEVSFVKAKKPRKKTYKANEIEYLKAMGKWEQSYE